MVTSLMKVAESKRNSLLADNEARRHHRSRHHRTDCCVLSEVRWRGERAATLEDDLKGWGA